MRIFMQHLHGEHQVVPVSPLRGVIASIPPLPQMPEDEPFPVLKQYLLIATLSVIRAFVIILSVKWGISRVQKHCVSKPSPEDQPSRGVVVHLVHESTN